MGKSEGPLGRPAGPEDPVYEPTCVEDVVASASSGLVGAVSRPWKAKFSVELSGVGTDKHVEQLQSFLQTKLEAILHVNGLYVRVDWILVEGEASPNGVDPSVVHDEEQ